MAAKSAPVYPVEAYTRNKGSVGRRKITFVGASYKFVHKVLRDMLIVGGFEDIQICLHDLNPEPLKIVGDLLEKIARQRESRVTVSRTLDLNEALKGSDIVILSITVGGEESDWRSAEATLKYGIPVGIGDTLGPPALARNLRTIPVVVDLIKRMEVHCPNAAMLNFTNPMSALTAAMARYSSLPVWGLCHSADELFRYFATVFDCPKSDVQMDIGGVNHQAFVTKLLIKGDDRTRDILRATTESQAKLEDNLLDTHREEVDLQQEMCRVLGAWPSTGDTHLAEFYPYFFTERRRERFAQSHMKRIIPGRKPFGPRQPPAIINEWTYGKNPVGDLELLTTEHAHELIWAYVTGEPFTRVLNVLNSGGFLKDIPLDACVEVQATVSGKKITAEPLQLPVAAHSLTQRWCAIHDLSIKAAMNCDRDAARQALLLDPHVRDVQDVEPLLEDILNATREWLPARWFQ